MCGIRTSARGSVARHPCLYLHNRQSSRRPARAGHLGKKPRRHVITASQFYDARVFSGLDREQAAEFLNVSVRTIGHWETGRARVSYTAFKLLRVYRHGDLIHPAWSACKINRRGALVTPEGHEIHAHDLTWLSLLCRRAAGFTDLLRQREAGRFPVAEEGRPAAAPPAGALGLVSSTTSDTDSVETLLLSTFRVVPSGALHGALVVPKWHHDNLKITARTACSESASRSQSAVGSACGGGGDIDQCGRSAGPPGIPPATGAEASQRLACGEAPFFNNAPAPTAQAGESVDAEGRPQRVVPVLQREKGQGLSPGLDQIGGAR